MSANDSTRTSPPTDAADTHTGVPHPAPEREAGTLAQSPEDVARILSAAHPPVISVPGYEILGKLGSGNMGVVYKARHVRLNRVVALKMILATGPIAENERHRFLAEAGAVAAVKHENVVQVHDSGECSEHPYIAFEYLTGGTLADVLKETAVTGSSSRSSQNAAHLIARIARGVAAAHAQGIVHRDLKPANVLFDETRTPKVADFGLAKCGSNSELTLTGQVMGTPAYMSPEQGKGDTKFVGPQADVWALGVILYEALAGCRPFVADNPLELMLKIGLDDPIPLRKVVSSIPRDLELICLKCLAKLPHERYPTATELADDLDRYVRGEPISVRPAGPIERGYKWVKRNKVVAGAMGAVALALLIGSGVSLGFGLEALEKKKDAEDATAREEQEKLKVIAARNELQQKSHELKRILAKSLLGPITAKNHGKPLTPYEVEAFWQLTELRRDEVPLMFLEEATRTPLACEQLECRVEYTLHAAIGLDLARRDAVDQLLLSRLREPSTQRSQAISLAMGISKSDVASHTTGGNAARALTDALDKATDSNERTRLAEGLAAVASRMEPAQGAQVCARAARALADALDKAKDSYERARLAEGLAAVADRMEPAQGARALADALDKATDSNERDLLARGLAAVANRMEPAQGARALMDALDKAKDSYERGLLARGLAAVADRMEPAPAAQVRAQGARALMDALDKAKDSYARARLAEGLAAVANRMEPAQGARALMDALDKAKDSYERGLLARGLAAVASRMEPAQGAQVCAQGARALMDALDKAKDSYERARLAEGLAAVANRMEPAPAAQVRAQGARALADALDKEMDSYARAYLARGLVAVASRMEPAPATQVRTQAVRTFADALDKATASNDRLELALEMVAVVLGLPADARGHSQRATTFAIGVSSMPLNLLPSLTLLYPHFPPHTRPFPPQALVELLKHPFCIKEAQRVVLDALELTYQRKFADKWEFVKFAQDNNIHDNGKPLDLLTPPKRSTQP